MANKNTSDSIEAYIKALLAQAGMAELKRSELADVFQVVPSQINYVIKTRFTESRGYIVESKRGGVAISALARSSFQITIRCSKTWRPILERPSASRSLMISSRCSMKKNY